MIGAWWNIQAPRAGRHDVIDLCELEDMLRSQTPAPQTRTGALRRGAMRSQRRY